MKNKWYCNRTVDCERAVFVITLLILCGIASQAFAGDAPSWMHAVVSATLPAHDDKTDAVLLYSEEIVNVQSENKVKTTVRAAYKILRPDGRGFGIVRVPFNSREKITSLHGWCIPAQERTTKLRKGSSRNIPVRDLG